MATHETPRLLYTRSSADNLYTHTFTSAFLHGDMSSPVLTVELVAEKVALADVVGVPAVVFGVTAATVSSSGVVTFTIVATAAAAAADTVEAATLDAEPTADATAMVDVEAATLTLVATLPLLAQLPPLLPELLLPVTSFFFCCCSSAHSTESRHPGCWQSPVNTLAHR